MSKRDQEKLQGWAKMRSKGMLRFVIVIGGIWGIVTAIISQLLELGNLSISDAFTSKQFLIKLGINVGVGILFFAPVFWLLAERKYKKMSEGEN